MKINNFKFLNYILIIPLLHGCDFYTEGVFNFINDTDEPVYVAISNSDISPYILFSIYGQNPIKVEPGNNTVHLFDYSIEDNLLNTNDYDNDTGEGNPKFIYEKAYILIYTEETLEKYTVKQMIDENIYDAKLCIDLEVNSTFRYKDEIHNASYPCMTYHYMGF